MIITKPNGCYEIEKELGRGAFGVTYLARQKEVHSRCVVIKLLFDPEGRSFEDPSFKIMFERETKALALIDHPYVVRIYDYGWTSEGKPFIVMQYVEGQTLRVAMDGRAMKLERAAGIVNQLGSALSAVHRAGVVHRDLKPENVMLQPANEEEFAILIDFGVAKVEVSRAGRSEEDTVAGTPVYMAPEQLRGHPVPGSDVWALGVVAYELVTGRRPFSAADLPMLKNAQASITEPRILCPELPKVAQAVILKALSHDPAHRYTHAHEMGDAFLRAVSEGDPPVRDSPPSPAADSTPPVSESLTELLRRCQELFESFDEFRSPESLRAFFSIAELSVGQNCVSFSALLDLDQLLYCLYRSGRDYRGQALIDVLSVLASHYKDDYRAQQCEQLRDSLKRLLERSPVASR